MSSSPSSLAGIARTNHENILYGIVALQKAKALEAQLPGTWRAQQEKRVKRNLARRLQLEDEWAATIQEISDDFFDQLDIERAYIEARAGWTPVTMTARLMTSVWKAGTTTAADVKAKEHTVQDVIDGRYKVGTGGGEDMRRAHLAGLYTTEVNGVGIYARDEEAAQSLIRYLKKGGEYGSRQFSRLLGYSKSEIDEYEKFLQAVRAVPTPAGAMLAPASPVVEAGLMNMLYGEQTWAAGIDIAQGLQMYLQMALATSQHAGQAALNHMGMNKTFSYAHPRAMARDLFAVRGSKVLNNLYGAHLEKLSEIITDATNPRHPKTLPEVKAQIKKAWPKLSAYQVARIARTETAAVWTATTANAYAANGITRVESIIAHGPSVGKIDPYSHIATGLPCDMCVDAAAAGAMSVLGDLPPWHPHCRCEIVPTMLNDDGTEWFPPDEPWVGGERAICGLEDSVLLSRRRSRGLRQMHAVLKAGGVAGCLTPASEPGVGFGGETFYNREPVQSAADAQAYHKQVNDWPDFQGDFDQAAVKAAARALIDKSLTMKLPMKVAVDKEGKLTSLAVYSDDVMFSGYSQTITVYGIATRGSGARRVMGQFARDAWKNNRNLAVRLEGVSPQIQKSLEHWGFKSPDSSTIYVILDPASLKLPFKIADDIPEPKPGLSFETPSGVPVHVPEPPLVSALAESLDDLKAQLYTSNNRIAGWRKKIKAEEAKAFPDAMKIEQTQIKLVAQIDVRDALKAEIDAYKKQPQVVPTKLDTPPPQVKPTEQVLDTPPLPPPVKVASPEAASSQQSTVLTEPAKPIPPGIDDQIEGLLDEASDWLSADQLSVPIQVYTNAAEAFAEGGLKYGAGIERGIFATRSASGELMGIGFYIENGAFNELQLYRYIQRYGDDVEGALRGVTTVAQLARSKNMDFMVSADMGLPFDARMNLIKRGMDIGESPSGISGLLMPSNKLDDAFKLKEQPKVLLPKKIADMKPAPAPYESNYVYEAGTTPQTDIVDVVDSLRTETEAWQQSKLVSARLTMFDNDLGLYFGEDIPTFGSGIKDGLITLRDSSDDLHGLVFYQIDEGLGQVFLRSVLRYEDDVPSLLRAALVGAKIADSKHMNLVIATDTISDVGKKALLDQGMEVQYAGTKIIEARVFLHQDDLGKVFDLGTAPKKPIVKPGESGTPSGDGTPMVQVHYINAKNGQQVTTAEMTEIDANDMLAALQDKGVKGFTSAPGEKFVIDDVSIGDGDPIPDVILEKIHAKNLTKFSEKGDKALEILGDDADTLAKFTTQGEWNPKRVQLHNDIIAAHFANRTPPPLGERNAYFTAGGAASGKSGMRFNYKGQEVDLDFLLKQDDVIYVDPDRIKQMIPEYKELTDAGDLYAAGAVHEESSVLSKMIAKRARDNGYSVVFDTTGSSGKFLQNIQDYADEGYRTHVSMSSITTNEAVVRSIVRAERKGNPSEGRYVALTALKRGHKDASLQLIKWQKMKDLTEWRVYDNMGDKIKLVAEKKAGQKPVVYDDKKFKEIKNKANEGIARPPKASAETKKPETSISPNIPTGGLTVEQLKANLYSTNNKIAGWKKKLKKTPDDTDAAEKLAEQEVIRDDIKGKISALGGKPVAVKPTAKEPKEPKAEADEKPKEKPEPTPIVQPDERRVVPGGITKEKGTTLLNKKMQEGYTGSGAIALKQQIMNDLTEEVRNDPRWYAEGTVRAHDKSGLYNDSPTIPVAEHEATAWDQIREAFGYSERAYAAEADKAIMAQLINNWAKTSSDADWRGVIIQLAVKKEFGVDVRVFAADYWNDASKSDTILLQAEEKLRQFPQLEGALRAFVRAQYKTTQKFLAETGVDEVTLYRGMRVPDSAVVASPEDGGVAWGAGLSTIRTTDNPIASWSIRHAQSRKHYFYRGTMLRASAPREMIFSCPLTGFGCASEYEVLILNAGDNSAWVAQNGTIVLSPERLDEYRRKIAEARAIIDRTDAEMVELRNMNGGAGPDWGTPEKQRQYELGDERGAAQRVETISMRWVDEGQEHWSYDKESELRGHIQDAVAANPALAGKTIKVPKPRKALGPQAAKIAAIKAKIGGVKRKITNNQKKADAQREIVKFIDYRELDVHSLARGESYLHPGAIYSGHEYTGKKVYAPTYSKAQFERRAMFYEDKNISLREQQARLEDELASAERNPIEIEKSRYTVRLKELMDRV